MIQRLIFINFFLITLLGSCVGDEREDMVSKGDLKFAVDAVGFRDSTGLTREVFTYEIFSEAFKNPLMDKRIEITAILYDEKGNQVIGDNWEKTLFRGDSIYRISRDRIYIDKFSFLVKGRFYRAKISLKDIESGKEGVWEKKIEVPTFYRKGEKKAGISEILFGLNIEKSKLGDSTYFIEKWKFYPNPSRIYTDSRPVLRFYYEIYGIPEDGVEISYGVIFKNKSLISEHRAIEKEKLKDEIAFAESLDLKNLSGGTYTLLISISDKRGNTLLKRKADFKFYPFYFPYANDFEEAIAQLNYIASEEELQALKKASSIEKRKEIWMNFWKKRDPSPGTEINEAMDEFYERIDYANKNFSRFGKGWKTDMGRVYVKFGPAEEIERHPFEAEVPAYEIWYYYSLRLKFLFIDRHGLGEYTLSNWDEFLRRK